MTGWTATQLREYIAQQRELGERLDKRDYFGRLWLADYAGMADTIGDCLEELLDQGVQEVHPFATSNAQIHAGCCIPMGGC